MGKITVLLNRMKILCNMHDGEDTFSPPFRHKKYPIGKSRIMQPYVKSLKNFTSLQMVWIYVFIFQHFVFAN